MLFRFFSSFYISFSLVVFIVFGCGWFSAYFFRKQLLLSLLSLELVLLGLFLSFIFIFVFMGKPVCFSFYLLVLGACEASLGLSLLVVLVRVVGNDMLRLFRFIKC
jgi:NADH:ubiquinone oxidoreductase subunit K